MMVAIHNFKINWGKKLGSFKWFEGLAFRENKNEL